MPNSSFDEAKVLEMYQLYLKHRTKGAVAVMSGNDDQEISEICRHFLIYLGKQSSSPSLVWLNGDSKTTLTPAVRSLAKSLEIPTTINETPIPLSQLVLQVADFMTKNSINGWVVVIDNVNQAYLELGPILSILEKQGAFVVVTTTVENLWEHLAGTWKLN